MFSFGKRSVVFVLILFIVIALVGWAWRQRDSLPFITKPLMTIMSPFEYGASRVMDSLTSSIHIVDVSLKNRIEWESLEKENADLKSRTVDYDEVVAENDRLRALLNFKSTHNQYQLLAGSVISRDYGTWTNTMIIDVGSGEGVEKDMPVITPSGVVGFISDVSTGMPTPSSKFDISTVSINTADRVRPRYGRPADAGLQGGWCPPHRPGPPPAAAAALPRRARIRRAPGRP